MIETCGWCKHFKGHKTTRRFAGGWWLGDGKCKERKATVVGDTCNKWEKKCISK